MISLPGNPAQPPGYQMLLIPTLESISNFSYISSIMDSLKMHNCLPLLAPIVPSIVFCREKNA